VEAHLPIDISKFRAWARIPSTQDDPAILIAWEAAKRELEERTGWCVDPITRTQYVAAEPDNEQLLVLAARQPVTAATYTVDMVVTSLTLVTINGLQYFKMPEEGITYPITITLSVGSNTLNPLLEMALLQRVTQHVASRGDDTVALSSDYWDRISTMMGKGIA
jgi:8-oxo-dGTP pyrophosphatase MutT (NUDIX family)